MNFTEKSLKTLELDSVLQLLSHEAVCDMAKEECLNLTVFSEFSAVETKVNETTAACQLMQLKGLPSFTGIINNKPMLDRAKRGGSLNAKELLEICKLLKSSRLVKSYIADDKIPQTSINFLFNVLKPIKYLEDRISDSIISEDEISDRASSDLADIRRNIRAASSRARESLQKIISSPSYSKYLQENIITMRSGRFVVPVKAEHKGEIPGLVHDMSSTGATLFIEPMAAVKANNDLKELYAKEKAEIERILYELSSECADHYDDILYSQDVLVKLDVIFAKAKLSYKLECSPAEQSNNGILLKKARHPLLDQSVVVPIDVELGNKVATLIITGPNTGGKTVSLKTIGLLAAMNQCGLHIPAGNDSALPVFSSIFADIGDEQSIEQSLSTFSSHMQNIVSIINCCDDRSLVLFDELGAGTDPAEGAALAVSIIEAVRKRGATIAATTHYTELKIYATSQPGVLNASCEFDVDTLKPTYKLLLGIPGKSNAFAISSRLGLDETIIEDAKSRVETRTQDFENSIERLESIRFDLEKQKDETILKLNEAKEKERKASLLKAEHEIRLERAELKAKREAEAIIQSARATAEEVFAELDEMKRRINEEENANKINEARNELRRKLNNAEDSVRDKTIENDDRTSSRKLVVGDYVEVKSMGIKGEVISINADRTIQINSGNMIVNSKEDNVFLLDSFKQPAKLNNSSSVRLHTESLKPELDIRGMDTMEGVLTAEQYIDNAVMNKLETVSIIHGKGTGALRSAIHKMLKSNKNVKSYRLGTFSEGESGVTIVNIK